MRTGSILLALVWVWVACAAVAAQDKPAVAVIGTGNLAGTLGPAMGQRGYPVVYGSRDPSRESVRSLVARIRGRLVDRSALDELLAEAERAAHEQAQEMRPRR